MAIGFMHARVHHCAFIAAYRASSVSFIDLTLSKAENCSIGSHIFSLQAVFQVLVCDAAT